jgi:DMSO reductase family type II enzyme molybdopterin subunit
MLNKKGEIGHKSGGWHTTRRTFIKSTGLSLLSLSLNLLTLKSFASEAIEDYHPYPYRSWEDIYREGWSWDKVVKGTHTFVNCTGACAFNLYIKDGVILREEQVANYPLPNSNLPDYNPRGCQKGACYSELMYNINRIKYPLKRIGERGEGKWKRISWDEALTEIADKIVDVIKEHGPEAIVNFYGSNIAFEPGAVSGAKLRFFDLIGGVFVDTFGGVGDSATGMNATWGFSNYDGTSSDWFNSDYIILWKFNPNYTRIPEAHFIWEARYHGATIVSIAPDYNASSIHADLWVTPKVGTDIALALGIAQVIIAERLYHVSHVKEQTDLPFLVRKDNKRFLRESDLKSGGKGDVFYFWDKKSNQLKKAPGSMGSAIKSLKLGDLDPALEGSWEIETLHKDKIKVTTVFSLLKDILKDYTPEKVSEITGVNPEIIKQIAYGYSKAKAGLIISSMGACKFYHADLMHRSRILVAALAGQVGKPGGGVRNIGLIPIEGQLMIAHPVSAKFKKKPKITPGTLWWYIHGGIKELAGKKEYGDKEMKRNVDDYVFESIKKGWMPLFPSREKTPKIFMDCGGNSLRRVRAPHILKKYLWPKLDLIININFRMDSTALNSDIVLPAAGYYEKTGFKYTLTYTPFFHIGHRAVELLYDSKDEWEIFKLLAKKVEQKAIEKGFTKYSDSVGITRDLTTLYHDFIEKGKFEEPEAINKYLLANSTATKGISLEDLKEKGFAPFSKDTLNMESYLPMERDQLIVPCLKYTVGKTPWPTITGRQQFYIDHDWFLDLGEELPIHKDPPKAGGNYPLRLTGGHTRWSIHSTWRDDKYMLRLQRGKPIMYMNFEDAKQRGIRDHDYVKVYNDLNSFKIHVKLSPSVQPGQVIIYHAWEPFQFEDQRNDQVVMPTPLKPLQLAGGYGQFGYRFVDNQPNQIDRDTVVEVVKL